MKPIQNLLLLLFSLFCAFNFYSQEYHFQYITQSQGLGNTFINSIIQDDRGYLFISTGEGIGIYNGQQVEMYYKDNKLADDFVTVSYKDQLGNIWFGHAQGGSTIFYDGEFGKVHPGSGIDSQINDIDEDKDGRVWFVAQDYGLYYYDENAENDFFPSPSSGRLYYSLHINDKDDFLLGTDKGIEVYQFSPDADGNHLSKIQNIGGVEDEQIISIINYNGNATIATSISGKIYKIELIGDVYKAIKMDYYNLLSELIVTEIYSARGYLWISTLQDGLLKCKIQDDKIFIVEKYNQKSGLKTGAVNTAFVDREGVVWIGTFGEGLAAKEDDIFTYYFIDKKHNNPITSIIANSTNIFVSSNGIIEHYDKQNVKCYQKYTQLNGIPDDEVTVMVFDKDSNLYIGTTLNGVYQLIHGATEFTKIELSGDNLSKTISDLEITDKYLYVATLNGAYRYDLTSKGIRVYNITTGLPHNSIGSIYQTKGGRVIVGTNSAFVSEIIDDKVINYPIKDGVDVVEVNDIFESNNGDVWFCTNGSGVFKLEEEGCYNLTAADGLMSNYCNSVRINEDNDLWISHNEGLSKVHLEDTVIATYDQYFGLNYRFLRGSAAIVGSEIWFGTENGIVLYNSDKDVENKVPPITSIRFIIINDKKYELDELIELPYGTYKFGFGLAGLTLKGAQKIKYSFTLDGYDNRWLGKTDKDAIYYTRMADGDYTFRVKCYNADGTEGNEATVHIIIAKPYWKTWWFYALLVAILVLGVYGIIKYRERSLLKYQEKLKRDLALRTREVVEQKNEIEAINKDLTDSINYAQRIQGSILPEDAFIVKLFPKSFVFFRPRDIVSGDFYWCGEIGDKKLIVCADCTGHGVPGGFMSMISHILLREAMTEEALENPALILQHVNESLIEVLKQTEEIESNRDGLDVAILVLDNNSNEVKFAGALRPLYLYRNGIRTVIKGDRYSLGGISRGKAFETKLVETQPGDILYIFSDGFADQYGGPRNSKMKLRIFQEYLDQVCQLPLHEQEEALASFFYDWKGEVAQMDDVLVIGIEV